MCRGETATTCGKKKCHENSEFEGGRFIGDTKAAVCEHVAPLLLLCCWALPAVRRRARETVPGAAVFGAAFPLPGGGFFADILVRPALSPYGFSALRGLTRAETHKQAILRPKPKAQESMREREDSAEADCTLVSYL